MRNITVPRPHTETNARPWVFFGLVFVLSGPFWLIAAATPLQLAPGAPVSALSAFCPMLAAMILCHRAGGPAAIVALLKRAADYRRVRDLRWYALLLLPMPAVMTASYAVLLLTGMTVPAPTASVADMVTLLLVSLMLGLGEELGWSGYALGPLQQRWKALPAALILGLVWASWHVVPLLQAHRTVGWIMWWWIGTMSQRVVMVLLFNATGRSVFGISLYHATINVTWLLFPVMGSYYDPKVVGLIMLVIATAASPFLIKQSRS